MASTPHQKHFLALDGFRGIASFFVVLFHSLTAFDSTQLPHAHLAVEFFFLLSGFVVAYAYESRLLKDMSLIEFCKIRLIRLYPLILFGLLFGLFVYFIKVIYIGHERITLAIVAAFLCGILMIPSYFVQTDGWTNMSPFNTPAWSLFFELFINFTYALILPKLSSRTLKIILVLSAIAVFTQSHYRDGLQEGPIGGITWAENMLFGFVRVTFPFFCGILIFRCKRPYYGFSSNRSALLLAIFLSLILISSHTKHDWIFESITVVFIFPVILTCGTWCKPSGILASTCQFSGNLSYPLYILHYPLLRLFSHYAREHGKTHSQLYIIVIAEMISSITFSILVMKLYDEPIRKWLIKKFHPYQYKPRPIESKRLANDLLDIDLRKKS